MQLRDQPIKENEILRTENEVPGETEQQDFHQFGLPVPTQYAIEFFILTGKAYRKQNPVQPLDVKIKHEKKCTKYE